MILSSTCIYDFMCDSLPKLHAHPTKLYMRHLPNEPCVGVYYIKVCGYYLKPVTKLTQIAAATLKL